MKIMTTHELYPMLRSDPEKYPLMILNPKISQSEIKFLRVDFHIYPVQHKGKTYDGMVPNIYKRDLRKIMTAYPEKRAELEEKWPIPEEGIYDGIVTINGKTLMLFQKGLHRLIKQAQKDTYMTDTIRYEGRVRSGVVCAYLEPFGDIDLEPMTTKIIGVVPK